MFTSFLAENYYDPDGLELPASVYRSGTKIQTDFF